MGIFVQLLLCSCIVSHTVPIVFEVGEWWFFICSRWKKIPDRLYRPTGTHALDNTDYMYDHSCVPVLWVGNTVARSKERTEYGTWNITVSNKAKKKKNPYVSKLQRAFVFRNVWFSKIQGLIFSFFFFFFFACLIFFSSLFFFFYFFYELACQNIQEKIWQTQWNTLNNRLLQLCVLSCILFIQNQVPYFKAVNDSNLPRLLLRGKKS